MPSGSSSKMATKNCPKCETPNPVACKKCSCGHVFFSNRRSAYTAPVDSAEDISEPTTPQEPEVPRRRTARVTRERPQFYDALQFENQARRQRELQKRRKASKSDDVEASFEEVIEKPAPVVATTSKRRAESPPGKAVEPAVKKRRGRPPGLTNRRTGRAQILSSKITDSNAKGGDYAENMEDEGEAARNIHAIAPVKALQMNMVLGDINARIASSSVRAEALSPLKNKVSSHKKDDEPLKSDAEVKASEKNVDEKEVKAVVDADDVREKTTVKGANVASTQGKEIENRTSLIDEDPKAKDEIAADSANDNIVNDVKKEVAGTTNEDADSIINEDANPIKNEDTNPIKIEDADPIKNEDANPVKKGDANSIKEDTDSVNKDVDSKDIAAEVLKTGGDEGKATSNGTGSGSDETILDADATDKTTDQDLTVVPKEQEVTVERGIPKENRPATIKTEVKDGESSPENDAVEPMDISASVEDKKEVDEPKDTADENIKPSKISDKQEPSVDGEVEKVARDEVAESSTEVAT